MGIIDLGSLGYFRVAVRADSLFSVYLLVPVIRKEEFFSILIILLRFMFTEHLLCAQHHVLEAGYILSGLTFPTML